MLIYASRASPKAPKRRSRAGCIRCKEKKKKCNEQRPRCDRCIERNLDCAYEQIKPRKRRKSSALRQNLEAKYFNSEQRYGVVGDYDKYQTSYIHEKERWDEETPNHSSYAESDADFQAFDHPTTSDISDDVEEMIRTESSIRPHYAVVRTRSQFPDLAMIAPSPVASPLLEFNAPVYLEFSERRNRRALVDHFCNVLSHLIVFKEDTGNPFRQLVLPLSHSSSPVLNAIFALSSAHLEYGGVENDEKSLDFHNRALQGLAKLINQNEAANRDEILGAIMLLVYYEVLVQRGTATIVNSHLRGAMTIMRSQNPNPSPTSLFLERAFRFYDVIAALSLGTAPISRSSIANTPYPQTHATGCSPLSNVDTLLGASTTLWPIIHRLSDLLAAQAELREAEERGNTSKASVLRSEFESTSSAIELALTNWAPIIPTCENELLDNTLFEDNVAHGSSLDHGVIAPAGEAVSLSSLESDPRLQSILANAEAYRQASLIYLYRYIRLLPTTSAIVQKHTKIALAACKRVVEWKGPMSALLWPLFISSCEAIDEADRDLSKEAFLGVEKRQGMTNIGRAWDVVSEVWRRGDLCAEVSVDRIPAKQICLEMGFTIVFG